MLSLSTLSRSRAHAVLRETKKRLTRRAKHTRAKDARCRASRPARGAPHAAQVTAAAALRNVHLGQDHDAMVRVVVLQVRRKIAQPGRKVKFAINCSLSSRTQGSVASRGSFTRDSLDERSWKMCRTSDAARHSQGYLQPRSSSTNLSHGVEAG